MLHAYRSLNDPLTHLELNIIRKARFLYYPARLVLLLSCFANASNQRECTVMTRIKAKFAQLKEKLTGAKNQSKENTAGTEPYKSSLAVAGTGSNIRSRHKLGEMRKENPVLKKKPGPSSSGPKTSQADQAGKAHGSHDRSLARGFLVMGRNAEGVDAWAHDTPEHDAHMLQQPVRLEAEGNPNYEVEVLPPSYWNEVDAVPDRADNLPLSCLSDTGVDHMQVAIQSLNLGKTSTGLQKWQQKPIDRDVVAAWLNVFAGRDESSGMGVILINRLYGIAADNSGTLPTLSGEISDFVPAVDDLQSVIKDLVENPTKFNDPASVSNLIKVLTRFKEKVGLIIASDVKLPSTSTGDKRAMFLNEHAKNGFRDVEQRLGETISKLSQM